MKISVIRVCAGAIIVMVLLMCSSIATETTWRHSGFELWGYDINFTNHNASNILNLDAADINVTSLEVITTTFTGDSNFTDHNISNVHILGADFIHGNGSNISGLNASNISTGELPLSQIPTNLTGKDADTLDGYDASDLLSGGSGTSGNYTGNAAINRAIPHGLGTIPIGVFISSKDGSIRYNIPGDVVEYVSAGAGSYLPVTLWDSTNFYVGHSGSYSDSGNKNGEQYYWAAF